MFGINSNFGDSDNIVKLTDCTSADMINYNHINLT